MRQFFIVVSLAAVAFAQPGIQQNGVFNSASQIPPTLAGGAIARGALFDIKGVRLGGMGHTTLAIVHDGARVPVPVLSVAARRIQARMPVTAPVGHASLIVTVDQQASRPFPIEIAAANPGIFTRNLEGWGPGRIDNIDLHGARSPNSPNAPAHPGQRVEFASTGLGATEAINVVVGTRIAAGVAGRGARQGEEEVSFQIPADAPLGCWVPVYLQVTPERASNIVTMSITSGSGPCDAGPFPWLPGQRIAIVALSRTRFKSERANAPDSQIDDARILFQAANTQMTLSPVRLLPPPGTCTAYTSSYQANTALSSSVSSMVMLEGQGLDAGKLLLLRRGPDIAFISQTWESVGTYQIRLSDAGISKRRTTPVALDPGPFSFQGAGGKDVGPFNVGFSIPAPFQWTDREQTTSVDRRRSVTLHWRGAGASDLMLIVARNVDEITTAIGMCLCTAPAAAGQFTIPAPLLANIPATQSGADATLDELVIGSLPRNPVGTFQAKGLNIGSIYMIHVNGRMVEYK